MFSFRCFKTVIAIAFLLSGAMAWSAPLSAEDVFQKLRPLAAEASHPTVFKNKSQIIVTLPSDKERDDDKKEWVFSSITAEVNVQNKVPQIYIETQNCNIKHKDLDVAKMQKRLQQQIRSVSAAVFGTGFELNGEPYFKELGPHWKKFSHVKIKEQVPGVKFMRIARSPSKCDGREGYRFRYDFFL